MEADSPTLTLLWHDSSDSNLVRNLKSIDEQGKFCTYFFLLKFNLTNKIMITAETIRQAKQNIDERNAKKFGLYHGKLSI